LPASAQPQRPSIHAVLIAIDEYDDRAIAPCPGAPGDAQALRRWLIGPGGWTSANVLVMDRQSQRRHGAPAEALSSLYPSRDNLNWVLNSWLPARVRPNDIVVIYFAGQAAGLPPKDGSPPGAPGRNYLLPIDARADNLDGTGWPLEDALDTLAAPGRNPLLLFLDTSLAGRGRPAVPGLVPAESARWLATLTRWPSVSAWLAADGRTSADGGRQRSPFLRAIAEHLGTPEAPRNLLGLLEHLGRDPALSEQGFRTAGGVPADLTLWAKALAPVGPAAPALLLQNGHADRVLDIAISPDGTTAFTAGADSTAKAWRLDDRMLLRTLAFHTISVTRVALSPDGSRLATADGNGRVWFWNLPDFRPLSSRVPRPHDRGVVALTFLGDATRAASLDADGKVLLWTLTDRDAVPKPIVTGAKALAGDSERIAVAISNDDGDDGIVNLRVLDRDGRPVADIPGPGGPIKPGAIDLVGGVLAFGDEEGHVVAWDVAASKERRRFDLGLPVAAVRLAGESLVVGAGSKVFALPLDPTQPERSADAGGTVDRLALSPDKRRVAIATDLAGSVRAWDLADLGQPLPLASDRPTIATALAFGPGGRTLVAGCQYGSIRAWDLPGGTARPEIPARRGQIMDLAGSPDGRHLVQITLDRKAFVWDLAEGRSLAAIPGAWTSAAFLDAGTIAMTDVPGDVALVKRVGGARLDRSFERPTTADGSGPSRAAFRRIATSPDGRWVAAAATDADLACVWDAKTGRLVRTIREHPDGVVSLAFSPDSTLLLTAGPTEAILQAVAPEVLGPTFRADTTDSPITAAAMVPGQPSRLVTGHADGQVVRWAAVPDGRPQATVLDRIDGKVQALTVTPDSAWLAAGGDDKALRLVSLADERARPQPLRLDPLHDERITALVTLPGAPLIASASEDTTIRLWRLTDRTLFGTLSAIPETGDWVAFTPEGQFDSSPGAERRVTWLRDGRVMPFDQFYERYRAFRLVDRLRRGADPDVRFAYQYEPPPTLALDAPPPTTARREVELAVTLAEPEAAGLRLYLNGIPVREAEDFVRRDPADPRRLLVSAPLRHGTNTLYAMAGRPQGGVEGRSNLVTIHSDAPDRPGRLHVLALGVDRYPNRPLKFSAADAKTFAEFVHGHPADQGIAGEGLVRVLTNAEVSVESVRKELSAIRAEAKPEDTVLVFLAGHTGVRRDPVGRERFCLLLPSFPLPKPGPGELLALRAGAEPGARPDDPKTIVPYATIYQYLVRFDALHRVVVIDACQAAAAADDPAVRRIQENVAEKIDDAAHRASTTYLLGSRRDDPAFEVDALGHGLLTHVLLRGMGAPDLKPDPGEPLPPADVNDDGLVTTAELSRYVDDHLPALAAKVAPVAMRDAPPEPGQPTPAKPLRAQAATEGTFPLVKVPAGEPAKAR
jgi:WD40 repeat protein